MGSISLGQINFHGWVAGSNETKANSAQFQVKLPTEAELGNFAISSVIDVMMIFPLSQYFSNISVIMSIVRAAMKCI